MALPATLGLFSGESRLILSGPAAEQAPHPRHGQSEDVADVAPCHAGLVEESAALPRASHSASSAASEAVRNDSALSSSVPTSPG